MARTKERGATAARTTRAGGKQGTHYHRKIDRTGV